LVPHYSSAIEEDSSVVTPLSVINLCAVDEAVTAVGDFVGLDVYQSDIGTPIPSLLSPLEVRLVLRERSKTSGNVKEAAIRDRVLIVIAIVQRKNLPSQAPTTSILAPATSLQVEHALGKSQPLWLIRRRIRKASFGRHHGSECPEYLIVVALRFCLVGRHKISALAGLV
jgi:hypothetical protein